MESTSRKSTSSHAQQRDLDPRPISTSSTADRVSRIAAQPALLTWIPIAVVLGLALRSAWVTDDAYITLRTVDNWVHGYGLRWNVDERVQAYTHPLWMFSLAAIYLLAKNAFVAAIALGLATTAASLFVLTRLARTAAHACAAILMLGASRSFIDFATSGLENPLTQLLFAGFAYAYLCRRDDLLILTGLSALMALNRVDASLLVLPALTHACVATWKASGVRAVAVALAVGGAPLIAWEAFSLFYYGTLVPNTAHAKLNTGIPALELATQGVVYLRDALAWDLPLLPIVGLGLACAFHERRLRPMLVALGVVFYLIYVVRIGGDFMQGRFLDVPLFAAVCLIARAQLPFEQPATLAALAGALALLFLHPNATEKWPVGSMHHDGVADERDYYRATSTFMSWTRKLPVPRHAFAEEGYKFKARGKTVEVYGCVGYAGFFSGPDVHIVDEHALTDPLLARLPPKFDPFWRTGHFTRFVPEGYVESLRSGSCEMTDRNLCKYYEKLRDVVSGDLWSWQRLVTLTELNLGHYDDWLDYEKYRYPKRVEIDWGDLSTRVNENQPWNAAGMQMFTSSGVLVRLPASTRVSGLELMFDGNDDYVLEFRRGMTILGTMFSESQHLTGVHSRKFDVPPGAASGFDRIFVRPDNGDGSYSIGFIRFVL